MIEDDEEQMKEELKEAFRIYDKEVKCQKKGERKKLNHSFQGQGFITNDVLKDILREIDNTLTEDDLVHIIEEVDEESSSRTAAGPWTSTNSRR